MVDDASDDDRAIAIPAGMKVGLGEVPDGYDPVDYLPMPIEDSTGMPRLHEEFGATRDEDGWYWLP